MAQSIKSANGKTEWIYDKGELSEIGPMHPKLTRSVSDTYKIFCLLIANHDDLKGRYHAEITGLKYVSDDEYYGDE